MSHSRRLLPLLVLLLWACTDSQPGPAGPSGPDAARLALGATFVAMEGVTAQDEIVQVRLTVLHGTTGAALADTIVDVDPTDEAWEIELDVPVPQDGARVRILIELLDATGETEWSGVTDPIAVRAGQTTTAPETEVFPGPPGNLDVDSVRIAPPATDTVLEGETLQLEADVFGGDPDSVRVVWGSLEPEVATVVADGTVETLARGTARIEAVAGPARDTATIEVLARIAAVLLTPEAPVLTRAGERVAMEATVVDARGEPFEGATVTWSIDDETVAAHLGDGVFEAAGEGTAEITATVDLVEGVEGEPAAEGSALITVAVPDLRPTSLEATSLVDGALLEGEPVALLVRVTNEGGGAAPGTVLGVGVIDPETGESVRPDTVVDVPVLESGDTAAVEVSLPAPAPGEWPASVAFRAVADAADAVAELDEADNELVTDGTALRRGVDALVLTPPGDTVTAPGDTARFTAALSDALGEPLERPVTWTSLDTAVATVDGTGLATATGQGSARIVAGAEGVADTATLVVLGLPDLVPENLVITTPAPDTVAESDSLGIAIDVRNAGGSAAPATSLALRVLDAVDLTLVDDSLVAVPALAPGAVFRFDHTFGLDPEDAWPVRVVLEAAADAGDDIVEVDETNNTLRTGELVVWRAATSIEITPAVDTVTAPGDTARFAATLRAFDGTVLEGPVGWISLDSEVATVDEAGLATAVASGSARIVAVAAERGGAADTATLVVVGLPDLVTESFVVSTPAPDTVAEGHPLGIALDVRNAGGSNAPATTLAVRVLDAADFTIVDDTLIAVPALTPGAIFHFEDLSDLAPEDAWPDRVVLEAAADASGDAAEADETNNDVRTEELVVWRAATSIEITPAADTVTAPGDTARFAATMRAFDGTVLDGSAGWTSLDPEIATVDGAGLATAVAAGSARIVAVAAERGEAADTATLVVLGLADLDLSFLSVGPALADTIVEGDTLDFSGTIRNSGAVDAPGTVLAVRFLDAGTGAVVADSLVQTPPIVAGDSVTFLVRFPLDAAGTWPSQVTVEAAADAAEALPEASEENNTRSPGIVFHVRRTVSFVVVSPSTDTLAAVGDTARFTATAFASDETVMDRPVSWSVLDPTVATVDATGLVTAGEVGTTTVSAIVDGVAGNATVVVQAATLTSEPVTLDAGRSHTCFVDNTTGAAYCWGSNGIGQLGDGSFFVDQSTPSPVSGGHIFASISAGDLHTCGVATNGAAYCWGDNFDGQLGDGLDGTESTVPVAVSGGHLFASISAGDGHTCALTTSHAAYCWGDNANEKLGDGTPLGEEVISPRSVPTAVTGGLQFRSISAGLHHSCGVTTEGAAYCWGSNSQGKLGDGTFTSRPEPTPVQGGIVFASITAGSSHTCGVTADGTAYCWGDNGAGHLGDGTNTQRLSPTPVVGGHAFTQITMGLASTCGLTTGGDMYCWGNNNLGQTGDGTLIERNSPTLVIGGHTWVGIASGQEHACAERTDGVVYCWGNRQEGQLGDGTTSTRGEAQPTPAPWTGLP